ncbi:MAG: hypothetical protein ACRCXA_05910 [Peptostreptococcaceae bacterium]
MKKYILPGVAVIFSGVIIYQTCTIKATNNELQNVSQQLIELKSINEVLQQNISSIDSSIQETLNEELGKSHLTKDVDFKLNKNVENGYDLNVRVELKELKENKRVLFMYKEESSSEWQQIELNEIGNLSYKGDFILQQEKEYEYKVILKGSTTESGDIEYIEKNSFMPEFPECNWGYSDVGIYIDSYQDTYDGEGSIEKIKKLEVIISSNKKEQIYDAKYTENPIYDENNEIINYDKRYSLEVENKDYIGNIEYIKVKVTYESGIIDIKDITGNRF